LTLLGPHGFRTRSKIDRQSSIIDRNTATITCAFATIDCCAPTFGCKPGLGTRKAATIDYIGPLTGRSFGADDGVTATSTCLGDTIDRGAERSDPNGGDDGLNSLSANRMRALLTGSGGLVGGNASSLDGNPETIDRSASHALLDTTLITRCSATIDHNSATIT
jgi:hypothetical protein